MRWLPLSAYAGGVVGMMVWMWTTYAAGAPALFVALYALTGIAAVGLLVSAVSPRRSLIDLCYYLFLTFFTTAPAAIQVATGDYPWQQAHAPRHAAMAVALLAVAMLAYEVGRRLQRRKVQPTSESFLVTRVPPTGVLTSTLVVGVVLGVVAVPLAGLELLLADRAALTEFKVEAGLRSYVFLILKGITLATAAWLLAVAYGLDRDGDPAAARRLVPLLTTVALVLTALLFNPLINPRFIFAAAVIVILFLVVRPIFLHLKPWAIVAFPFALFYVFPHLKALSDVEERQDFLDRIRTFDVEYLTSVDFDTFQCAANAVRYVEEMGLLGLQQLVGGLLFFIPRAVWAGKPHGSGLEVFDHLGYWYINVSMPLHMEFYLAAGVVGVIVGMAAFGAVAGWLETASLRSARGGLARTPADVLVALVGGFAIITMRGSLAAVAVYVGLPLVWGVVTLVAARAGEVGGTAAGAGEPDAARRDGEASFGDWRDRFAGARRKPAAGVGRRRRPLNAGAGARPVPPGG